ncbi:MAG: hypothetical protein EOP04_23155, partial [Proteobacteria bacterium]
MKPFIWSSPENFPRQNYALPSDEFKKLSYQFKLGVGIHEEIIPEFTVACDQQKVQKWDVLPSSLLLPLVRRNALHILAEQAKHD